MDTLKLVVILAIPILTAAAVWVSLRRNRKVIDEFDQPDLDELKICLPRFQLKRAKRKLASMGWELIETKEAQEMKGNVHLHFRKIGDASAAPIKSVLHKLNRALLLPTNPFELIRQTDETTS